MKILNYLRPIWEGADNKPSIRRILAIGVFIGIFRMVERSYREPAYILNNDVLVTLTATMVLLLGIVTVSNLIEFFAKKDNIKINDNE